jgi:hypothetical protein
MIDASAELMRIAKATLSLDPPSWSSALSDRLQAIAKHLRAEQIVREACESGPGAWQKEPSQPGVSHTPER